MILSLRSKERNEPSGISLFGKVPARADFVRINHGFPASLELDTWLQQNLEELVLAGNRFIGPPLQFLFAADNVPQVLIGVLAPSKDKAGRSFPVTIFGALGVNFIAQRVALIPVACAAFMSELHALITDLPNLDYSQLKERVGAITPPHTDRFVETEANSRAWLTESKAGEVLGRLFCDDKLSNIQFALQTLFEVIDEIQNPAGKKAKVLDCPAELDLDAFLWLEIFCRKVGRPDRPPSFFWAESPQNRLLLSKRIPPVHLLRDLALPEHTNSCIISIKSCDSNVQSDAGNPLSQSLDRLSDTSTLDDFVSMLF